MSIPEYFAGNPLKYPVTRDSVDQALTSIVYIHGGWITVESTASLLDIDVSKVATGQIAYVSESRQFYIAKFYPVDWSSPTGPFEDTVEWSEFAFSGSFQGDGSQLTGIASSLYLSGSTGSDTVNLKTDALTLTGSAGGIIVTVTDNKATFTIASPATISGSFTGDGSGLSGVGGVPGGTVNQIQYNSASAFGGAEIYYSSSGNLGIGVTNPSVKLHVDGNAIITGTLTAQEFHTEFVSASIIYQSGSTKFGDSADDLHSFTGSVNITGSITALAYSGSFSGSFQGDGSNLTGIASTLALSGSTGNDLVNLKTEALTLTGSARNIDVAVTNNTATATVANNLQLSDVELTGSFKGAFEGTFSGSVDAVITNAITASYVLNAISASYALTSSYALTATSASHALQSNNAITASYSLTAGNAISASYSTTASYVPGYVRDSGGQVDEVAIWSSTDQISGSQGFFVSRSFGGNVATFLDGYYYSQNNGAFVALSSADASGSRTTMGMYNPGTGTAIIYAGSGSGVTTGAIKIATDILDQAYAIGTNISPNKANTLRIEPTVELLNGITGSFSGSFYGQFVGLIDSASYAVYAVNAATASYVLNAVSASYAATASYAFNAVSASYATTSSYSFNAVTSSYALTATSASHALQANNAITASHAINALTASYFTGSHIDFTPRTDAQAPAYREGRVWYDADNGALAVYNNEADITLQVGQEFYVRVFNPSSSIANGTPVYISGSQGDYPYIWPATAEDHTTGAHFDNHILGLATHDIGANSSGYVTRQGIVRNIDTTAFAAGDELFLQTGSAGLRNTPPPFPYDVVQVGFVIRSQANGFVLVDTKEPVHFSNISGLSGSGAAENHDLWVYDGSNNAWYNTHSGLSLSGSFSGSFSGTVDRAISSSHAVQADASLTSITASYATKAESVGILNQDVTIVGDLTVYGTSSFVSVTSSRLDVDYDFISVNVFEPAQRFGGLRVYDSGSESHQATASLAWDSTRNHWVYENVSGSTYSGGGLMSGPRNTGSLGDEPYPTLNTILRGQGGDHLYDANITDNDTVVSVKIPLEITGSVKATGNFSGSFIGDGSGLSGVAANPAGADKSVQFKSGSVTGGASNFFYDHVNARVGIGTTGPTEKLHIAGGGSGNVRLDSGGTYYGSNVQAISSTGLKIGNDDFSGYAFFSDEGNVGINTTSPSEKLHVVGNIRGAALQVYDGLGAGVTGVGAASAAGALRLYASGALGVTVNTTRAVQLNGYGSGTNTGTATKSLAVDSSGNVIEIDVSSNGTGVANQVAFWKDTDTVSGSQDFTWDGTTLSINGVLEANEKSFVINHPTQPGKKLVYGVLEGPEHAVYCRGKISGEVIELPEEWTGLVHEDSITVQLTSIGKHQNLYVVDIRDNKVFIKNGDLLTSKINAYYYIQATRKDTKPLQTVRDK